MAKYYSRQQVATSVTASHHQPQIEEDQGRWCYCKEEREGGMIGCDNRACEIKWFHIECVSMASSSIQHASI